MADIFQTSVSGLLAFQRALATTSHNISNLNTPGYSRQVVDFATSPPQFLGGSYLGTGVETAGVRRLVDESRVRIARDNITEFARLETFAGLSGRIDNLLADESAGLAPSLQNFFAAVHQVTGDAGTSPAREVMLTEARNLVARFGYIDQRFEELEGNINSQIRVQVAEVNQYAESIARLNQEIAVAYGRAQGGPPNDLLDKRDHLVSELAKRIAVQVVPADGGVVNVFIGNGQSLVLGNKAAELAVGDDLYDPTQLRVTFVTASGSVDVTRNLTGGSLGGLFDFRREVLDPVRSQVGALATSLAVEFNRQHRLGMQFDTDPPGLGGDFFKLPPPQVLPRSGNAATLDPAVPLVAIDEAGIGELNGADYRLSFDGTDWILTRTSDNSVRATLAPGDSFTGEGIRIDTAAITGAPAAGDSFLIQPARLAAGGIDLAVSRGSQIAAAQPLVAGAATDPATGQSANKGSGSIGGVAVSSPDNLPLAGDITLTFDAAAGVFHVTGPNGLQGTITYDPAGDSGGVELDGSDFVAVPPSPELSDFGGLRFTLSGIPADGDAFVIRSNATGTSDGGNALALSRLQSAALMQGGKTSFGEFYSGVVAGVATTTLRANVNRDAQEVLRDQAIAAREEVSGVNLEEEAANMLRFQQAYQASAQVVTVARSLFESLLAAVGR